MTFTKPGRIVVFVLTFAPPIAVFSAAVPSPDAEGTAPKSRRLMRKGGEGAVGWKLQSHQATVYETDMSSIKAGLLISPHFLCERPPPSRSPTYGSWSETQSNGSVALCRHPLGCFSWTNKEQRDKRKASCLWEAGKSGEVAARVFTMMHFFF